MQQRTEWGEMAVHDEVLATLAGVAASESYGVVGMASRRVGDGIAVLLHREHLARGVRVTEGQGEYEIDLFVIMGYGVRIGEVGKAIARNVSQTLRQAVGVAPRKVIVHVEGVRK
ncbi:MAG: Asp23/Gls24 family envelope stress response protein [Thermaerobacter sp.]|nr:Asp23/Gls24 family envelope stress response protein [Thermaerobacter sp.]